MQYLLMIYSNDVEYAARPPAEVAVLRLASEGAVPAAYNGVYDVTFTGTKNFSYRLAAGSSPGSATTPGTSVRAIAARRSASRAASALPA